MRLIHSFRGRLWAWVWVALFLGISAAGAHARVAAPPPTDSVAGPSANLPSTLTALRVEMLVPGPRPSRASHPDPWLARDKARHVVFSGLWTLSTQYVLVRKADWSAGDALPVSILTSAGVGLGKELYDASRTDGRASGKDLVANAVGIGLAAGIIAL